MAQQILKSKGIDIPYITTLHGTDITLVGRDKSFEPVIRFAIDKSTAVTAVSKSLKKDTIQNFHIKREIHVIPNFICPNDYELPQVNDLKLKYSPNGEMLISHVSNFRKVKRIDDVVYVFRKILDKIPARLLLAGDGPERANIESLCKQLDVFHNTVMLGELKSTVELMRISDLFLLPSETESFGLSALEAMAAGVPVISSNTGGIPEVNVHGQSGYLSNVGDVNSMANYAIEILSDPDKKKLFGEQAKKIAENFDIRQILPLYEKLYNSLFVSEKL
jgi:N-acetyl-alpha-D-glucosaminyl L-malate synthase BshA